MATRLKSGEADDTPTVEPQAARDAGSERPDFDPLAATIPPTPRRELMVEEDASLYILSEDLDLLSAIDAAANDDYPVEALAEWAELVTLLQEDKRRMILLDADHGRSDVRKRITQLNELSDALVVLVAANAERARDLIDFMADRSVYRVLVKPANSAMIRLLLESAVNRFLTLKSDSDLPARSDESSGMEAESGDSEGDAPSSTARDVVDQDEVGASGAGDGLGDEPDEIDRQTHAALIESGDVGHRELRAGREDSVEASQVADDTLRADTDAGLQHSLRERVRERSAALRSVNPLGGVAIAAVAAVVIGFVAAAAMWWRSSGQDAADAGAAPGSVAIGSSAEELSQGVAARENATALEPEVEADDAPETRGIAVTPDEPASAAGPAADSESTAPELSPAADTNVLSEEDSSESQVSPRSAGLIQPVEEEPADVPSIDAPPNDSEGVGSADQSLPESADTGSGTADGADPIDTDEATVPEAGEPDLSPADVEIAANAEVVGEDDPIDEVSSPDGASSEPAPAEVEETPPVAAAAGDTADALAAPELESYLLLARARLDNRLLHLPVGNSAVDYVTLAAEIDPESPEVLALVDQVAEALVTDARVDLEDGDLDAAAGMLDRAFELGRQSEALVQLQIDLSTALVAREAREQAELFELAEQSLIAGQLFEPADDSAIAHARQLATLNPGFDGLDALLANIISAITDKVREMIAVGDWEAAEAGVDALVAAGSSSRLVSDLRTDLTAGRLQQSYLRIPAEPGELTLSSTTPARYPAAARRGGVEGWVDLEFIVDENGEPTGIRVIQAEPEGWFEEAAIEAVTGYRFQPFEGEGRVYERLARLRVRFGLE